MTETPLTDTDTDTDAGEPQETVAPGAGGATLDGSFGDIAGEMTDESFETEVELAESDMIEEGGPIEAVDNGLEIQLAERTADLQRLQAEYLNYKKRVDRDRDLVRQNAVYTALTPIIDVLDNIDRAREHGPLEDGFKAVAEQLERVVAGQGLTRFGAPGDVFDPNLHEAISHIGEDPEVTETTCKVIVKGGYQIGDRVVRAAQVLVVDPVVASAADSSE